MLCSWGMTDTPQPPRGAQDMHDHHFSLATDPAAHVAAYRAAFATGSSALVDRFYEPGAVLVPQPGMPLQGVSERMAAYDHLLSFGVPMTAQTRHVYVADDTALLVVDWSMRGTTRQGEPLDLNGVATDVARRGTDGRWRYLINNPFGAS
jgi:ketosteroid isomerase-like protein